MYQSLIVILIGCSAIAHASNWYLGCVSFNETLDVAVTHPDQNVTDCAAWCWNTGYPYTGIANGSQCHCLNETYAQGLSLEDESKCNIRCASLSVTPVTLTCGGDRQNQLSLYKSAGPYLSSVTLKVIADWLVVNTSVTLEATANIAAFLNISEASANPGDIHPEWSIEFLWTIDSDTNIQEVIVATGDTIISRVAYSFLTIGDHDIDVTVTNILSTKTQSLDITVIVPEPRDLQIGLLNAVTSLPSCIPTHNDVKHGEPTVAVFVNETSLFEVSVAVGANLRFTFTYSDDEDDVVQSLIPDEDGGVCVGRNCTDVTQEHVFAQTGVFSVRVSVWNEYGALHQNLTVVVVDQHLSNLTIQIAQDSPRLMTPQQAVQFLISMHTASRYDTFLELSFDGINSVTYSVKEANMTDADVTTGDGENPFVIANYGDGCVLQMEVDHIFHGQGTFQATAVAYNNVSRVTATSNSHVTVIDELRDMTIKSLPFVAANTTFSIMLQFIPLHMPLGVNVTWTVLYADGQVIAELTLESNVFEYSLSHPQTYVIRANASNQISSITKQIEIEIQIGITGVIIDCNGSRPFALRVGNTIRCTAQISSGSNASYEWQFSDSASRTVTTMPNTTVSQATHKYINAGQYNINVTVRNDVGSITVVFPHHIHVQVPIKMLMITSTSPNIHGNETAITATVSEGTDVSFEFDFGAKRTNVTQDNTVAGTFVIRHTYLHAGIHPVTVNVHNMVSSTNKIMDVIIEEMPESFSIVAVMESRVVVGVTYILRDDHGVMLDRSDLLFIWTLDNHYLAVTKLPLYTLLIDTPGRHTIKVTSKNLVGEHVVSLNLNLAPRRSTVDRCILHHDRAVAVNHHVNFSITCTSPLVSRTLNVKYTPQSPVSVVTTAILANSNGTWTHRFTHTGIYKVRIQTNRGDAGRGSDIVLKSYVIVQVPIVGLRIRGPEAVALQRLSSQYEWEAEIDAGTDVWYKWSMYEDSDPQTTVYNKIYKRFNTSRKYHIHMSAQNAISQSQASLRVSVQHMIVDLEVNVPAVVHGTATNISLTVHGAHQFQARVDFGDGNVTSISSEDPSANLLQLTPPTDTIVTPTYRLTITHLYKEIGDYDMTINVSNFVSWVESTMTAKVEEPIEGIILESKTASILRTNDRTNVVVTVAVSKGNDLTFVWDFMDPYSLPPKIQSDGNTSIATHMYTTAGTYGVVVKISNSLYTTPIAVRLPFNFTVVDELGSLSLDAMAGRLGAEIWLQSDGHWHTNDVEFTARVGEGSHVMFEFDFGDGLQTSAYGIEKSQLFTYIEATVRHRFTAVGVYKIGVQAINPLGNLTVSKYPFYVQIPPIRPTLDKKEYINELGTNTRFHASIVNGTNVTFHWKFGDEAEILDGGLSVVHEYKTAGIKTVRLIAKNHVASEAVEAPVKIQRRIQSVSIEVGQRVAAVGGERVYAVGENVVLYAITVPATSDRDHYRSVWSYGSDVLDTVSGMTWTKVFHSSGRYTITVIAKNDISSATSAPVELDIIAPIKANRVSIVLKGPPLYGSPVTFVALEPSGSDLSYTWKFGDNSVDSTVENLMVNHVTHTFNRYGAFTVTVVLTNLLGSASADLTVFITRTVCLPPLVNIPGGMNSVRDVLMIPYWNSLRLEADVTINCTITQAISYQWTIINEASMEVVNISTITERVLQERILFLPPRSLPYGNYTVQVKTQMLGTIVYTKTLKSIEVTRSLPKSVIEGGKYVMVKNTWFIVLNGSRSYDPDGSPSDTLRYHWTCYIKDLKKSCFTEPNVTFPNKDIVYFKGEKLQMGIGEFHFNLTVSKDGRESVPTRKILLVDIKKKFHVELDCPQCSQLLVNSHESLGAAVVCNECLQHNVVYKWELETVSGAMPDPSDNTICIEDGIGRRPMPPPIRDNGRNIPIPTPRSTVLPTTGSTTTEQVHSMTTSARDDDTTQSSTDQPIRDTTEQGAGGGSVTIGGFALPIEEVAQSGRGDPDSILPDAEPPPTEPSESARPAPHPESRTSTTEAPPVIAEDALLRRLRENKQDADPLQISERGESSVEKSNPVDSPLSIAESTGQSRSHPEIPTVTESPPTTTSQPSHERDRLLPDEPRPRIDQDSPIPEGQPNSPPLYHGREPAEAMPHSSMSKLHPHLARVGIDRSLNFRTLNFQKTTAPANPAEPVASNPDEPVADEGVAEDDSVFPDLSEGNGGRGRQSGRPNPDEGHGDGRQPGQTEDPNDDPNIPPGDPATEPEPSGGRAHTDVYNMHTVPTPLDDITTTGVDKQALAFRPEAFTQGLQYIIGVTVEVQVKNDDGSYEFKQYGWARVDFEVNHAPNGGLCSITQRSGIEMETRFLLNCREFKDEHQPLRYEAHFSLEYRSTKTLIYHGFNPIINFYLPAGLKNANYTVWVHPVVLDSLGAKKNHCAIPVTVYPGRYESLLPTSVDRLLRPSANDDGDRDVGTTPGKGLPKSLEQELYEEATEKGKPLALLLDRQEESSARLYINYLARRLNQLDPVQSHPGLVALSSEERLQLRLTTRHNLLNRTRYLPIRDKYEIIQTLQATTELTYSPQELTAEALSLASDILEVSLEQYEHCIDYNGEPPFSSDVIPLVIQVASNVLHVTSHLANDSSQSVDVLKEVISRTSLVIEKAVKEQLRDRYIGEEPVQHTSSFFSVFARLYDTLSGPRISINKTTVDLPERLDIVLGVDRLKFERHPLNNSKPIQAANLIGDAQTKTGAQNKTVNEVHNLLINGRTSALASGDSGSGDGGHLPPEVLDMTSTNQICFQTQLISYHENPYSFINSKEASVHSDVTSLSMFSCDGHDIKVADLEPDNTVSIDIARTMQDEQLAMHTLYRNRMNIHEFHVDRGTDQSLHINIECLPIDKTPFPISVLVRASSAPTWTSYDMITEFQPDQDNLSLTLSPAIFKEGVTRYYLGIADATQNAGRPRQHKARQRDYALNLWWGKCLYWDISLMDWSCDGCWLEKSSSFRHLNCRCNHMTLYASQLNIIPNTLTFTNIEHFFENPVVFILVFIILLLYGILLVICRRADLHNHRQGGVVYLQDNAVTDHQKYRITLETGFRKTAGTTAKISIILHGEEGMSETRELISEDMEQQLFERNSQNTFVMTLPDSLGKIWKVQLWHNNFGSSPSWYLSRVIVMDTNTAEKYYFICEKWLAVEEDDGKVEREFTALEGKLGFDKVFWAKGTQYAADFHLWASLLTRPSYSRFTYAQRLTCCLTLLMSYMALNMVWYKESFTEYRGEFGLLDISWRSLVVGAICCALVVPVNICIALLFRRSKQHGPYRLKDKTYKSSHKPDESSSDSSHDHVQPIMTHSILDQYLLNWQSIQEWAQKQWVKRQQSMTSQSEHESVDSKSDHPLRQELIGSMGLEEAVMAQMFQNQQELEQQQYHLQLPASKKYTEADQGSSGFEDAVSQACTQHSGDCKCPKHSNKKSTSIGQSDGHATFLLPFWFRYLAWILCFCIVIGCSVISMFYAFRFGYTKTVRWLQSFYFSIMVCIFIIHPLLIFLATLFTAMRFRNNPAVFDQPGGKCDDTRRPGEPFREIRKEPVCCEECDELEKAVAARQRSRYLRFARPPQEKQLIESRKKTMKEKKAYSVLGTWIEFSILFLLLGIMTFGKDTTTSYYLNERFKSVFIREEPQFSSIRNFDDWWVWSQSTMLDGLFSYLTYDPEATDRVQNTNIYIVGPVHLRQIRVRNESCPVSEYLSFNMTCRPEYGADAVSSKAYGPNDTWLYSKQLQDYSVHGRHNHYGASGYIIPLNRSRSSAYRQLEELKDGMWIDRHTRAVLIEFSTFYAPGNLFTSVSLLLETPAMGGAFPTPSVTSTHLYRYITPWDNFILACELLFILVVLYKVKDELVGYVISGAKYFHDPWRIVEVVFCVISMAYIACYIYRFILVYETKEMLLSTDFQEFVDISGLAIWDEILKSLLGFSFFLVICRSMYMLRYKKIFAMLGSVYRKSHKEILLFFGMFSISLVAFTSLGYAAFGVFSHSYREFWVGLGTMAAILTGSYSVREFDVYYRVGARLFVVFYLMAVGGILLAYIIAVLSFRYKAYRQREILAMGCRDTFRFLWQRFLLWAGFHQLEAIEEPDILLPAEFTIAEIEYQVDELLFRMNALSNTHGLPEKPPCYFTDSDGTAGMGDDGISSGECSEKGGFDDDHIEHRIQKIEDNLYSQDSYLAQLISVNYAGAQPVSEEKEKQLRSHLELEIFRRLQMQRQDDDGIGVTSSDGSKTVSQEPSSGTEPLHSGIDSTSSGQQSPCVERPAVAAAAAMMPYREGGQGDDGAAIKPALTSLAVDYQALLAESVAILSDLDSSFNSCDHNSSTVTASEVYPHMTDDTASMPFPESLLREALANILGATLEELQEKEKHDGSPDLAVVSKRLKSSNSACSSSDDSRYSKSAACSRDNSVKVTKPSLDLSFSSCSSTRPIPPTSAQISKKGSSAGKIAAKCLPPIEITEPVIIEIPDLTRRRPLYSYLPAQHTALKQESSLSTVHDSSSSNEHEKYKKKLPLKSSNKSGKQMSLATDSGRAKPGIQKSQKGMSSASKDQEQQSQGKKSAAKSKGIFSGGLLMGGDRSTGAIPKQDRYAVHKELSSSSSDTNNVAARSKLKDSGEQKLSIKPMSSSDETPLSTQSSKSGHSSSSLKEQTSSSGSEVDKFKYVKGKLPLSGKSMKAQQLPSNKPTISSESTSSGSEFVPRVPRQMTSQQPQKQQQQPKQKEQKQQQQKQQQRQQIQKLQPKEKQQQQQPKENVQGTSHFTSPLILNSSDLSSVHQKLLNLHISSSASSDVARSAGVIHGLSASTSLLRPGSSKTFLESSSGSEQDGHRVQRPSGKRSNLRKTKSRGKGKGGSKLTPLESLDDDDIDETVLEIEIEGYFSDDA